MWTAANLALTESTEAAQASSEAIVWETLTPPFTPAWKTVPMQRLSIGAATT
jgi:hypothetical protein